MAHRTTIGDTPSLNWIIGPVKIRRGFGLVWLGLLLWGCATDPILQMKDDAAERRVDLIVREAQAEASTLRAEVAAARIAAAKKEAELPELRRQVAELQRTAEAKQGELAALRADRERVLQSKTDLERQVAELQRTAEAKQGELAALRADRDRLLQSKPDQEGQITEQTLSPQGEAEVSKTHIQVAETQSKLKELETTQAAMTAELAQMKEELARTRGKAGGKTDKPAAKSGTPRLSNRPVATGDALMPSDRRPVRIAVERGDTLALIAQLYGVSVPALKDANGLRSDLILVGQELVIPRSPGMPPKTGANGR